MARAGPEVADIFRRYGTAYRETHGTSLCAAQRRVMSAIELCRTAVLGGHVERCDRCDHQHSPDKIARWFVTVVSSDHALTRGGRDRTCWDLLFP